MTKAPDLPPIEACREQALKLLDIRPHSVAELRRKLLQRRKFSPEHIDTIIMGLVNAGLLNDRIFAEMFCEYLKSSSSCGKRLAEQKLRLKGIAPEIIRSVLEENWDNDDGSDIGRATELAQRKWQSLSSKEQPVIVKKQKIARFLASRGFSSDVIYQILHQLR